MPAPTPPKKRVLPVQQGGAPASTQPLTVNAAEEIAAPAASAPTADAAPEAASPPVVSTPQEAQAALAAMASQPAPFTENEDGSLTIELEYPIDVSRFGMTIGGQPVSTLERITLDRATWKRRRKAARMYPPNATALDQDTCLMAELGNLPMHVIDELDGRDAGLLQMALGKLLYSQRLSFAG